ncbi:MAG TPA: DUF5615 family PIN-like protein [Rhizobiaceae bacterium]|nr:DUF5615 family PIN-like protein [Rhizobiaceae bacterium]
MKFLADECAWRLVVDALREIGWHGSWIHEISPSASDREILELSVSGKCVIVTEDADFGDLIFREGLKAYGVVRVCLSAFQAEKKRTASGYRGTVIESGKQLDRAIYHDRA